MKNVVIVDYGLGNIFSIKQALRKNGFDSHVTSDPDKIKNSDGILLPGVGAFGDAMNRLKERDLVRVLREEAKAGKPILGVCLGLQLLFGESEEFGNHEGLGIFPGSVQKFPEEHLGVQLNVPFIGWNKVEKKKADAFSEGIGANSKLFLVHSFYVKPKDEACVLGVSRYQNFEYPVLVRQNNVFGVQGHPEKSGTDGLNLYANWLKSL